jgi:hypothetical protein
MTSPNRPVLVRVGRALGSLRNEVVLVGGQVAELILSAPAFLATKWEAFADRGAGDLRGSHDVEDVVTVVAGRGEVVEEVRSAERDGRRYLAERAARFLDGGATPDIIAGALPDARLAPGIVRATEARFVEIASLR